MNLDHDTKDAVRDAVTLVNTADPTTGDDTLVTVAALADLLREWGMSGRREGTAAELAAVRALRDELRAVFVKASLADHVGVVGDLNSLIAGAGAVPQLVEHDGNPLHFHYTPADAPLRDRIAAEFAIALAIVVRDGGIERLRICDAPDCGRVFVDLSRNRSRRFCATLCGNRQNVAAYRQRQANAASDR